MSCIFSSWFQVLLLLSRLSCLITVPTNVQEVSYNEHNIFYIHTKIPIVSSNTFVYHCISLVTVRYTKKKTKGKAKTKEEKEKKIRKELLGIWKKYNDRKRRGKMNSTGIKRKRKMKGDKMRKEMKQRDKRTGK